MDVMSSAHSETDGESEGVWSPEIEQAFQEAMKQFPPCGRRKHILQEEGGGKMYGRNELIARYIEQKTGQKRTRKQVSSHIQVLSRREARARTGSRTDDTSSLSPASSINAPSSLSNGPTSHIWDDRPIMTRKIRLVEFSAFIEKRRIISPSAFPNSFSTSSLTFAQQYEHPYQSHRAPPINSLLTTATNLAHLQHTNDAEYQRHSFVKIDYSQSIERQANKMEKIDIREIQDKFPDMGGPDGLFARSNASDSFFLVKFWADLDFYLMDFNTIYEDQNSYFGFSNHFETLNRYKYITCSTKACSYGDLVIEKVDKIHGAFNSLSSTYTYNIDRSPMCEFMIQFIKKICQLPELPLMNRILENFTVLQTVTSESSSEVLLCIAYVFEIAPVKQANGSHYHVYKLTKD